MADEKDEKKGEPKAEKRPRARAARKPRKASKARKTRKSKKAAKATRKQFLPAQRAAILGEARAKGLTGKQAAAKYGISMVTYYVWRKRSGLSRVVAGRGKRGQRANGDAVSFTVRSNVRAHIQKLLPTIVRQEAEAALKDLLD